MRRSLSWHFLLYSLAIILVAIVGVALVTLLLVNANFSRQEEQYLTDRGHDFVKPLQSVFQWGGDPTRLQDIASFGLLTGHLRIRVIDQHGRVLADSGSYDDLLDPEVFIPGGSPARAFQLLLDESGHYRGFRLPAEPFEDSYSFIIPGHPRESAASGFVSAAMVQQPPIAAISEAAISLPLRVDSQVVGYAELSEGPAFGQTVRENFQRALIIGGLVALAVAAIAATVAARQVARPLQSLGATADEMAQGNLGARASGSKLAEIDRLAAQFNTMADQLTANIASLEAERQALRRFIADASHELCTPLTALKTFSALLAQNPDEFSGRDAELIAESDRQINRLDRITTDLLDLRRLEARVSGTDLSVDDIRPVIGQAVASVRP